MIMLLYVVLAVLLVGLVQSIFDKEARARWAQYPPQVGIAFDQLINALLPPFSSLSYADETMSARIYRAAYRGRLIGVFLMPIVNFMFRWQGFPNHCERAYHKEIERRSLPPEYAAADNQTTQQL